MFHYLLVALLVAAAVHIARSEERTMRRVGEITLLYVLVGYCGLPMVLVSVLSLAYPGHIADVLGFPAGNPFQGFMGFAYLGMSLAAVLALWYRGVYRVGPALCWIVFFAGATVVHLNDYGEKGILTHGHALGIFATHGFVSLLLVAALLSSGLLRERG